jgi:hypothetical protein
MPKATITEHDATLALRRMEMQERLHRALDILAGDEGFPDEDPVADDVAKVAALSDLDLLRCTYGLMDYVPGELADRIYRLLDEVFERFCPDVAWADHERSRFEEYGEGSEQARNELAGDRKGVELRAALRKASRPS